MTLRCVILAGETSTVKELAGASQALLRWYDAEKRDLPWRGSRDPYRLLVSEIMLQQTQVDKVIPYFERFIRELPDLERLVKADMETILGLWSGLGYYRRARSLAAAGEQILQRGGFPQTVEELMTLPGVGAYTAAAVASMAFGVQEAAVDGNVERVLSRLLALPGPVRTGEKARLILEAGRELLDPQRPGDSNQAMMELGALRCRPRRPACDSCPVSPWCRACQGGEPELFPGSPGPAVRRKETWLMAVVEEGRDESEPHSLRQLLFRRLGDEGLLAGLWELPTIPWRGSRRRAEHDLAESYGGEWQLLKYKGQVRHAITFRDIKVRVYSGRLLRPPRGEKEAAWLSCHERDRVPTSSVVDKALSLKSPRKR